MGDGKKLKEYLDEKGTNVRRIAKETGISATTLYTIIQKDSNIRFDFALRLANALDIDVNESFLWSYYRRRNISHSPRWIEWSLGCKQSQNLLEKLSLSTYVPIR